MARLIPLLMLLACGSEPITPGPATTTTTDSAVSTTTTGASNTTGEQGQLTYWQQGQQQQVLLYAADSLNDLPFGATCAMAGTLCVASLPTEVDVGIQWVDSPHDPATSVSWLGNQITLGPAPVDFSVIPATGFGGYRLAMPNPAPFALDLATAGEWGDFSAEAVLNVSEPMVLTSPLGFLELIDDVPILWEPGNGLVYMEVDVPATGVHSLWLLEDDGEHLLPNEHFGDLGIQDVATITLYRVLDQPQLDVNNNTLSVNGVGMATFIVAYDLPPWRDDFETGALSADYAKTGNANWSVANAVVYEGAFAAKSGNIGNNETSTINMTLTFVLPGTLSFWRQVDTEPNFDYLRFKIDGVEQASWSGNVPWGQQQYNVDQGQHRFTWTYTKDISVSTGADTVYIDLIESDGLLIP